MENLTVLNCGILIVGIVFAFFARVQAAMAKVDSVPFTWDKWRRENWIDVIMGAMAAFIALALPSVFGVDFGDDGGVEVHALLSGLGGQLLASKLKAMIAR